MKLDKEQLKWRFAAKKLAARKRFEKSVAWVRENQELAIVFVPLFTAACAGLLGMGRSAMVTHRQKSEEKRRALSFYDQSARHSWMFRRPLSNAEWMEVARRHDNGERYGDIFESMKVLK